VNPRLDGCLVSICSATSAPQQEGFANSLIWAVAFEQGAWSSSSRSASGWGHRSDLHHRALMGSSAVDAFRRSISLSRWMGLATSTLYPLSQGTCKTKECISGVAFGRLHLKIQIRRMRCLYRQNCCKLCPLRVAARSHWCLVPDVPLKLQRIFLFRGYVRRKSIGIRL
jgi:hypothetical protein